MKAAHCLPTSNVQGPKSKVSEGHPAEISKFALAAVGDQWALPTAIKFHAGA